jgi:hypothetical protein
MSWSEETDRSYPVLGEPIYLHWITLLIHPHWEKSSSLGITWSFQKGWPAFGCIRNEARGLAYDMCGENDLGLQPDPKGLTRSLYWNNIGLRGIKWVTKWNRSWWRTSWRNVPNVGIKTASIICSRKMTTWLNGFSFALAVTAYSILGLPLENDCPSKISNKHGQELKRLLWETILELATCAAD